MAGRSRADAVVVGGGINGLAAAARLARSGWSVAMVDDHDRPGGFVAAHERDGYVHDTWSSWHPLFVTGPAYAAFGADLHRHGLAYANTDGPLTATVTASGAVALAHRDVDETVAGFTEPADRDAYRAMIDRFDAHAAGIGGLLGAELHAPSSLRPVATLAVAAGRDGLGTYARDALTSGRSWMRARFRGPETDRLWAPWLLHAGLAPDSASGGLMVPVLAATMHGAGLPVVTGGAGNFVAAWERLLAELGVVVHTGRRVERILLRDGGATGVAGDGFEIVAERAVLASVTPPALYGSLLPAGSVPAAMAEAAARFRPGRAAMQIHAALSGPVPWTDRRLAAVPLVHLSDGSGSTAIACAEAEAGLLPRRPTVVVGQQHVLDPSRVPDGTGALWLQLQELPFEPVGDAAGELASAGGWDRALPEGDADRVIDRVEAAAPGLRGLVRRVDVLDPAAVAAHNPNALRGDPYAGSAELDQNFWWRPLPTAGGHATPVRRLWQIGASTYPGARVWAAPPATWSRTASPIPARRPGWCPDCAGPDRRRSPRAAGRLGGQLAEPGAVVVGETAQVPEPAVVGDLGDRRGSGGERRAGATEPDLAERGGRPGTQAPPELLLQPTRAHPGDPGDPRDRDRLGVVLLQPGHRPIDHVGRSRLPVVAQQVRARRVRHGQQHRGEELLLQRPFDDGRGT